MASNLEISITDDLATLINKAPYPLLVIGNSTNGSAKSDEERIKEVIFKATQKMNRVAIVPNQQDGYWSDDFIEQLRTNETEPGSVLKGLVVIYLKKEILPNKIIIHASLVSYYTPEVASTLALKCNIGRMLHAKCMRTDDLTQPQPANLENTDVIHDSPLLSNDLQEELALLDTNYSLMSNSSVSLYLFQGKEAPALMQLIGLGRETTFRAIGAGSGNNIDLSAEDDYYHHLTLWDKEQNCLVGAYRIGFTDPIISEHGASGLYLDHIFKTDPLFYQKIGNAMELSRSFILPQYQKNPQMLDSLWKGLGLTATKMQCYTLYGSVTISASFTPLSQAILVDTLDRYHSDQTELRNLVKSKAPFQATSSQHPWTTDAWSTLGINKLNAEIEEIEQQQRSIPPLLRYYVSLGAKFLAFHVEPSFNNAIYCLLRVDLRLLPKRYKKRFLSE